MEPLERFMSVLEEAKTAAAEVTDPEEKKALFEEAAETAIALCPRPRLMQHGKLLTDSIREVVSAVRNAPPPTEPSKSAAQLLHEERARNEKEKGVYLSDDEIRRKDNDPVAFEHGEGARIVKPYQKLPPNSVVGPQGPELGTGGRDG